ncbi:hypothetical protein QYE76_060211 [Lolium multiflorum]|uniref:F-box domain-containing protein n=1 Tax=Lolium multiflorum TaxID=4521 RepID=A0AAD8W3K7_LOLMU|nr:hypothetical protein QYE76_060211 [Lolium multiflorum]
MAFQPPPAAAPTTITDLGDDLLRQIFLRLPALPSLVRAASACRAFRRAVGSCPAFRRNFRAVHGPPLLALFLDTFMKAVPTFPFPPPLRRPDRDLFAVNFFDVFRPRAAGPGWEVDASNIQTNCGQRAIYSPLTQGLKVYPRPPTPGKSSILHGTQLEFHTLTAGEDGQRRRPVSSTTKTLLHVNETAMDVTVLRGFLCWAHRRNGRILVLDAATLRFSLMDLPTCCGCGCTTLKLGETEDGKLCIVGIMENNWVAWLWAGNDAGVGEEWMKYKVFPLGPIVKEATKCSEEEEGSIQVGL